MEIKPEDYKEFLKEEYLSLADAAAFLEISEEELRQLIQKHEIPTHNIAGAFTRLRRKEIEAIKNKWRIERELFPKPEKYFAHHKTVEKYTIWARLADFWYFNDFYIICSIAIMILLYFILASQ